MYITPNEFVQILKRHGLTVHHADAFDLAAHLSGLSYDAVQMRRFEQVIPVADVETVITQLKADVPVAYITGRKEFFGREFVVSSHTLIPRPDTEILIEAVLERVKTPTPRVLDLCTGTGCILLTLLAEMPGATGVGVDLSSDALAVAEKNRTALGLTDKARFLHADVLGELPDLGEFDIITCNPPYVTDDEFAEVEPSVLHEPKLALVADENGLAFYKKLLCCVDKFSTYEGFLFFEIGFAQGEAVLEILRNCGRQGTVLQDLRGNDRVLVWQNKTGS